MTERGYSTSKEAIRSQSWAVANRRLRSFFASRILTVVDFSRIVDKNQLIATPTAINEPSIITTSLRNVVSSRVKASGCSSISRNKNQTPIRAIIGHLKIRINRLSFFFPLLDINQPPVEFYKEWFPRTEGRTEASFYIKKPSCPGEYTPKNRINYFNSPNPRNKGLFSLKVIAIYHWLIRPSVQL